MNGSFTTPALQLWNAIPEEFRDKLLHNVWCNHCKEMTTIIDFVGRKRQDDLILNGHCAECGGKVARVIEGDAPGEKAGKPPKLDVSKLLERFHRYLVREKNLSVRTADSHCKRINFFYFSYLQHYAELSITEVDGEAIDDFIGNWYIRKVLDSCKSDIRPTLSAFKKFYQYLHQQKMIESKQLQDIMEICGQAQGYIRRMDRYESLDFEAEDWDDQLLEWMYNLDEDVASPQNVPDDFEYDAKFEKLPVKKDLEQMPMLKNFNSFLDYIAANNGLKLTASNEWLPRAHLLSINAKMMQPEDLPASINQDKSGRLHALYQLADILEIFIVSDKNKLEITPLLQKFQEHSPSEQFAVMFDHIWNIIPWQNFKPLYSGGRPDLVQKNRSKIAHWLSHCQPGKRYQFKNIWIFQGINSIENLLADLEGFSQLLMADDVFESRIFPLLKDFALLDFSYEEEREEWKIKSCRGIASYAITPLGQKVFKLLASKEE